MSLLNDLGYDYELDKEYIAQSPVNPRDHSRLFVIDRKHNRTEHRRFFDILEYINKDDLIVLNDTKVIKARFFGHRKSGGACEIFLLRLLEGEFIWESLIRPAKRIKQQELLVINDELEVRILEKYEDGRAKVEFISENKDWCSFGNLPLPPYISGNVSEKDYQTVFAKNEGAVAAPTAGLHFTKDLLEKIESISAGIITITLHVGIGTFRSVTEENLNTGKLHKESYEITKYAADRINKHKLQGGKIIACGTTSCRALESSSKGGYVIPGISDTELFIMPGYKFKIVDSLITNFHLPRTSLLMLVSALAGKNRILDGYEEAKKIGYRYYSLGDAMFIL